MQIKKIIIGLCIGFFVNTLSVSAQVKTENEEKPYIEVTGVAEREIIPDQIFISIIIREKYVNKEKVTIEFQEERIKTALKEIGLDLSNLSLSDANADFVKIKFKTKDVLTKKEYSLKVSDATTVGQVFQQLEKLEITDAFIAKVSHSKIDSLKRDLRIVAIKAAKTKADYLLVAIGEQTGKALIVREVEKDALHYRNISNNSNTSYQNVRFLDDDDGRKNDERQEIQFQKIKIQSSIYVKFLIK